jgi:hypothetical protein
LFSRVRNALLQTIAAKAVAICRPAREIDRDRQNGFVLSIGRARRSGISRAIRAGRWTKWVGILFQFVRADCKH